MRKKQEQQQQQEETSELELIKAVAQAWHGHAGNTRTIREWEAHRSNYTSKPSRFKIEAMKNTTSRMGVERWDFTESLWDSYEIVTVSRQLETRLTVDSSATTSRCPEAHANKGKESKNSLRRLLARSTSRRRAATNAVESKR